MNSLISIIIPCYNHGRYLPEALESVKEAGGNYSYEIIIINDGSTDPLTKEVLTDLEKKGYNITHQNNQGLAAARNNAIKKATGQYIIPLDCDNKLHKNYLRKAIDILEQDHLLDIVYGNAYFFGEEERLQKMKAFRFEDIIEGNYIDACAVFRKTIWEKVGGYDGAMPAMGNEDWEFWIHSFLVGGKFFFLDDLCFYYRRSSNSMSVTTTKPAYELNRDYIHQKHASAIISYLDKKVHQLAGEVHYTRMYLRTQKLKAIIKIILGRKI